MNILLLGAAGFIGTNLIISLAKDANNHIIAVDKKIAYFDDVLKNNFTNVKIVEETLDNDMNFDSLLKGQDIIYHLVSTTVPTTSNQQISQELMANVVFTSLLLEACVRCDVKKIIFISSGGTVYGKEIACPLKEDLPTYPISSYGIQKITIEKLLYLYNYLHGLSYKVIRLSNPYGPFQRPNGILGAITTFTYRAIKKQEIIVYGDGEVVRDFIYIDDAIRGILNIANKESEYNTFNLGSGKGASLNDVIQILRTFFDEELKVDYRVGRKVDVPINYLDISRYEKCFGRLDCLTLEEGIKKTADFLCNRNY